MSRIKNGLGPSYKPKLPSILVWIHSVKVLDCKYVWELFKTLITQGILLIEQKISIRTYLSNLSLISYNEWKTQHYKERAKNLI